MEPLAVSISYVSKLIGLGRTSIYSLIAAGELKTFKVGRRTLVRMSSLRELIDRRA